MTVPAIPELQYVRIDPALCGLEGNRLCYMQAGNDQKAPIVLLHGIGSNSSGWRYVLDAFGSSHRVIAWNAPGYILSDNFVSDAPSSQQYADALAAFLDALNIDSTFLAGSSFGSMIASTFAARYPARVKKLVLSGSSRGLRWLSDEERAKRMKMRGAAISDGGLALAENRWAALLSANPSPTAIRLTQEVLKATNKRGFLQSARALDGTDVLDFAARITAPALLIVGNEDRVNPPEISEAIHRAIPKSRLVRLEGVGHLPKIEAPERVVKLLAEHFGD